MPKAVIKLIYVYLFSMVYGLSKSVRQIVMNKCLSMCFETCVTIRMHVFIYNAL